MYFRVPQNPRCLLQSDLGPHLTPGMSGYAAGATDRNDDTCGWIRPGFDPEGLFSQQTWPLTCGNAERQTSQAIRRVLSPDRLAAVGETAIHLGPALPPVSCGLPGDSGGQPSNVPAERAFYSGPF